MLSNAQPKPRPRLLAKREAKAEVAATDRAENKKVKARSGGRCEVWEWVPSPCWQWSRCRRNATQVHHLVGGIGRRNVGVSILASAKLHVCQSCHEDITGHVLKASGYTDGAAHVVYERVR